MSPLFPPLLSLLLLASATAQESVEKAEAPGDFTPSKYKIEAIHLPPGPGGKQVATSRTLYRINFGSREGVKPGSIFAVFFRAQRSGLVRIEKVWRDSAHARLIRLERKLDYEMPAPLKRGSYLKPEFVILETVLFGLGRPDFSEEMHERLHYVARFIREFPDAPLVLEGHSDNTGKEKKNIALSLQRAEQIRDYLHEVHRLPLAQMHLKGYGSAEPIATNATAAGRQQNRRVDITLVDQIPGLKAEDPSLGKTHPSPPEKK